MFCSCFLFTAEASAVLIASLDFTSARLTDTQDETLWVGFYPLRSNGTINLGGRGSPESLWFSTLLSSPNML